MKVVLNCTYGGNIAGEIVDLKAEVAQGLLDSGFAKDPTLSDSSESSVVKNLRAQLQAEKDAHEMTKAELATKGATSGKASNPK